MVAKVAADWTLAVLGGIYDYWQEKCTDLYRVRSWVIKYKKELIYKYMTGSGVR